MKSYSIILADPPWPSVRTGARGNADDNYKLMTLDEICRGAIPAAEDCAPLPLGTLARAAGSVDRNDGLGIPLHHGGILLAEGKHAR